MLADTFISGYRDVEKLKASHKEELVNFRVQHKAQVECVTRELKESYRKEMEQQQSEMMAAAERKHKADVDRITRELNESYRKEMKQQQSEMMADHSEQLKVLQEELKSSLMERVSGAFLCLDST